MKVSVIIPTYNYGRFVRDAVESVQRQTVQDLEIIVIDDGSTDETSEVLASIQDPRLQVVRTPNGGMGAARNQGLERARGEFVAFLDADDRWLPNKLELQLEMMEAEPDLGAVFTNFSRFEGDHVYPEDQFAFFPELKDTPTVPAKSGIGRRVTANAFAEFVSFGETPTWVQTLLFRAEAIRGLRLLDRRQIEGRFRHGFGEDMHFCLRAFYRAPVGYIDLPLVEVRRHGSNISTHLEEIPHARLAAFQMLEQEPFDEPARRALRRRIGRAWVVSGMAHLEQGYIGRGVAAYLQALRYPGFRHSALKRLLLAPYDAVRGAHAGGRGAHHKLSAGSIT